jgi:hypothetical protein
MKEIFNIEEAKKQAKNEARCADMKQHADKLIQGFEKLDKSHARRAIWELFQNAIDLSEECEAIITITDNSIEFKHNGKPFTSNTLISLIKQVSSKKTQNNADEIGQYGTGFITTHSFGKKIILSGSLETDNRFIHFENFEIDRIASNSNELIPKLMQQEDEVFNLFNNDLETERTPFTTFFYQTISDLEKQNAENAILELGLILPYAMTINNKLQKVTVFDKNNNETVYQKINVLDKNDLTITHIQINQTEQKIYSISTEQKDLTIILPLKEQNSAFSFNENLAKLFLFFPLIGTENFGFNLLLHSKQFAPTEPRDGIHLKSKNEQVQEKENNNRVLLQKAFGLINQFIENHYSEIQDIHLFSKLNFNTNIPNNPLLSEYFKELKKTWVDKFKTFPLVENFETSGKNRISPNETLFFKEELLQDDYFFDSIYAIVHLFWKNIPKREITKEWTVYVTQWEDSDIKFIDIKQIAEKIEKTNTLAFCEPADIINLKRFYEYIIKFNKSEIFNQYKILPNVKDEFKLQSQLNTHSEINDVLIEIADIIIPDVPKRYLKEDFNFSLSFEQYERKQFVKDINAKIAEYKIDKNSLLETCTLSALIKYCSIFSSENTGVRANLLKLATEYYKIEQPFINLTNLSDTEWWLTPLKCMLRNLIWGLNTKDNNWVKENTQFLNNLLSVVYDYYEFKDIIQTLPIFPNQQYCLCKQSDLKIDGNIPEELKDLYDNILEPIKQIREILILNDYSQFLNDGETKTPESLGSEIENKFELQSCTNVSQHEHIQYILKIIKKISDDDSWRKYFPVIESKKASIMLDRISDNETKNDLFSIIGLEKDKIALLGELSRKNDLKKIIELGMEALKNKQNEKADFQFKHTIGTHIEKLVRERLNTELISIKLPTNVEEQQGGQDIIIKYDGKIVYYIEVKSRWDKRNSITMSPLQMENAVKNKLMYSLCCVEMSDYRIGEEERYNVTDINEIIERITLLSDIGSKIEPILTGILAVKDKENEISLIGDYRGVIPQSIVKQGDNLTNFINCLIEKIKMIKWRIAKCK